MFKQLAIIPFLLGTPTIKNAVNIQPLYNKSTTAQKSQTNSDKWTRTTIYDYGNIGQNNNYGLQISMRQIEIVSTRIYSSYERITVENYYYIEIKTNSLKFNATVDFESDVSYLPENWNYILTQESYLTYQTGYNIADLSTTIYSVNADSTINEITSTMSILDVKMEQSDQAWQFEYTANSSQTALKQSYFNIMTNILNGQAYNVEYTRQYNEEVGFIYHTVIESQGNYTNSQEESYININRNAVNKMQWNITLDQSSPTPPTPTPTPDGYEVVDIGGLIFYMLGMPFAWMSTAFNLTIFPNTPYSINIGALFLGLVGVVLLIFILKKILK